MGNKIENLCKPESLRDYHSDKHQPSSAVHLTDATLMWHLGVLKELKYT